MVPEFSLFGGRAAGGQFSQALEGVDPRAVTVTPMNLDGVTPDGMNRLRHDARVARAA